MGSNSISSKSISRVRVEGLHKRLGFEIDLNPGVNIIYGKNGLGKTTLLHIISNLSESDFERFEHLVFDLIYVENNFGEYVKIKKNDSILHIEVNSLSAIFSRELSEVSDEDRDAVIALMGGRATYLPAFRSVLERMREGAHNSYDDRSRPDYETLFNHEVGVLREGSVTLRVGMEMARSNVSKTLRCRDWFGKFVPIIRYPSILEVVSGLGDEWSRAQVAIARVEQKQFEAAFGEIFTAIAKGGDANVAESQVEILDEIRQLVWDDDSNQSGPNRMSSYLQLVEIAEDVEGGSDKYSHILQIYRNKLRERRVEREGILHPIDDFKNSVNKFLSEKSLQVGRSLSFKSMNREMWVHVSQDSGGKYGLTSLSSGERQIVTMLYSTSRSFFDSGCCLIDEPELSLHVDWQRMILKHIEKQHVNRQIIACTHSPEVGSEYADVKFFEPFSVSYENDELDMDEGSIL